MASQDGLFVQTNEIQTADFEFRGIVSMGYKHHWDYVGA